MSNAQKPNKHLRTKSIKKSGRAGKRAHQNRFKHGKGKGLSGQDKAGRRSGKHR